MQKTLEDLVSKISVGERTLFDLVDGVGLDGRNYKRLEMQLTHPPLIRQESPARAHVFHDVSSLIDFLEKYKTANTIVLGSLEERVFTCVVDAAAEDGVEVVQLQIKDHPRKKLWQTVLNRELPVKDFAQFLLRARRDITSENGMDLAYSFRQIKASVNISQSIGSGKKALNGVMIETNIKGVKHMEEIELPDSLKVTLPLFIGSEPREFSIDLSIDATPQGVTVFCSSADLADAEYESVEQMLTVIQTSHSDVVVGTGKLAFHDWKYQRD